MIIAHASVSILANRLFNKEGYRNKKLSIVSDILAALFGILPDFDLFYLIASNDSAMNHHSLISHTPIFWIGVFLFLRYGLYAISRLFNKETGKAFNKEIINIFTFALLIGTLSHLIADLFTGQIILFYPIYNYAFSLFGNIAPTNIFVGYTLHPVFGLELILVTLSAFVLLMDYFEIKKLKLIATSLLGIVVVSLSLIYCYIYYVTYHREIFPMQNDGLSNYDQDNDHLIDSSDLDTNNDGKNNLRDVNYEILVTDTYEILKSGKLTGYNDFALSIGGYDSSRIILGAYGQQNKPMEPVLYNYLVIKHRTLRENSNYMKVLLDYLTEYKAISQKQSLESLTNVARGNLFFIMDSNGNLVNEGMKLNENDIAIVLPKEKYLQIHKIEDLKPIYSDTDFHIVTQK